MTDLLRHIKSQKWFYEYRLPDGSTTESYLQEHVRGIHVTRERALREFLNDQARAGSAVDAASHEGYYSLVLSEYFDRVVGIDKNAESLAKARQITELLGRDGVSYREASLETLGAEDAADFVLCFGLVYHVENPLAVFRRLAQLARHGLCIETQVLPFQVSGQVEDGSHVAQRPLQGLFGVCRDYSSSKEGGLTDIALVPCRNALHFILTQLGFARLRYFEPADGDYEQFVRGHRVIVFAER